MFRRRGPAERPAGLRQGFNGLAGRATAGRFARRMRQVSAPHGQLRKIFSLQPFFPSRQKVAGRPVPAAQRAATIRSRSRRFRIPDLAFDRKPPFAAVPRPEDRQAGSPRESKGERIPFGECSRTGRARPRCFEDRRFGRLRSRETGRAKFSGPQQKSWMARAARPVTAPFSMRACNASASSMAAISVTSGQISPRAQSSNESITSWRVA